ncbi:MAG: hypothetical protein JRF33_27205, partial [Deltaproteobacteria bacterium]|nr:hypothetical protein [Deltaproteobacteria bacterium]
QLGSLTDTWYIQILFDNEGHSFTIHFDPEELDAPGSYEIGDTDAVSISVGWPSAEGDTDYASHLTGALQIDSVGYRRGETMSGSFTHLDLEVWDEDAPNPCLYLSDGRFEATNVGTDAY